MSFSRFIENLQNKSENDRRLILWVSISIIFGMIFFVWLTTFNLNFTLAEEAVEDNQISPFESVARMVNGVVDDIGRGYDVFQQSVSGTEGG